MAEFQLKVQPHERDARNDKRPRQMPQPFGLDRWMIFPRLTRHLRRRQHGWRRRKCMVSVTLGTVQRGETLTGSILRECSFNLNRF